MPFIIDDNFSSYATGSTTFGSWYDANGGGSSGGTIVDGSGLIGNPAQPDRNWTPADGHIPATTKSVFNFATGALTGPQGGGVVSWSQLCVEGSPTSPLIHFDHLAPGSSPRGDLFTLHLAADFSLTITSAGGIWTSHLGGVANSQIMYGRSIQPQIWHFFQVGFQCIGIPSGGIITIHVGASVSVDGLPFVDGNIDTGIVIPIVGDAFISDIEFGQGTQGLLTNVTFDSNPLATIPYPATPPLPEARISQALIEYMNLPSNAKGRISAFAMEYMNLPTNAKARISAMVIELLKSTPLVSGAPFPEYIRRRIAC